MDKDVKEEDIPDHWKGCNEDKPIRWLISAPTMRVPQEVDNTVNAFLAFKAVILAGKINQYFSVIVVYETHHFKH